MKTTYRAAVTRWPLARITLRQGARVCLGHLEIVNARDVLDNAVAYVVPEVHSEGEVRLSRKNKKVRRANAAMSAHATRRRVI